MDSIYIDAKPRTDSINVEIDTETLAREIGNQGILETSTSQRQSEFCYLASIALECKDDDYTISDTLMEFIENASQFEHLDKKECDRIRAILEGEITVPERRS